MIGVIGIGQCGSCIAQEAHERGVLSAVINYSQKDLDCVDVKHKLKLQGSEGVGKDRREAIRLFEEQYETAVKFVQERFSGVDGLIFAFSSSGGSGAGVAPILMDVIRSQMSDKAIAAFVVLPDLSESSISQINCLETFEELSRLGISVFPIDNQQAKNQHFIGKNKVYEYTNQKAIDLLVRLMDYTDKHSKHGNFDKKDFLTVLNTAGITMITETELTSLTQGIELSSDWVGKAIQQSFMESVFTPCERTKVTKSALIFDGQEALMEYMDSHKIFSYFNNGNPIEEFEGYYTELKGRITLLLSGLDWINSRLGAIESILSNDKDKIQSTLAQTEAFKSGAGDLLSRIKKQPEPKSRSISDIISKYRR